MVRLVLAGTEHTGLLFWEGVWGVGGVHTQTTCSCAHTVRMISSTDNTFREDGIVQNRHSKPPSSHLQVVQAAQTACCVGCECEPQGLHHLCQILVGLCVVKQRPCIGIGWGGVQSPCCTGAIAHVSWAVGAWYTHHKWQLSDVGQLVIPGVKQGWGVWYSRCTVGVSRCSRWA